jgi:type II secretory pathway component GspD/PulD (secretin)
MVSVNIKRVWACSLICISLAVLIGILGVPAAHAQAAGAAGVISLDVVDADLSKVVLMLARESKQSIIIADPEKLQSKVTATLRNMPLEMALKYVVESVGCMWRREANGVYIISSAVAQPVQAVNHQASPSAGSRDDTYQAPADRVPRMSEAARETKVETIKLYNCASTDMMWLLGLYKLEDASKIEKAYIKPGVDLKQDVQTATPHNSTPPFSESLRDNRAAGRVAGVGGEAAQFGMPGAPPAMPGAAPGGAAPAAPAAGRGGVASQGSALLPKGIDFIMPYDLDNSLIVRGDEEGLEEMKNLVRQLDVAPKQIMIKAEFVEISTDDASTLGIDWRLERLGTTFSNTFNTVGNVMVGYANGNVIANLKASLANSKGKLVNGPLISTMNNVPATIQIGKSYPYWTSTTTYDSRGNPITNYTVQFLDVATELLVLPRVNNSDNSITCTIQPTISDSPGTQKGPDGTEVPIVTEQTLQTTRRVANGETIVLGGIIRKEESSSVSKIPLLGNLPIIGPLFSSTSKLSKNTELLIFLTPTIVPDKPMAGSGVGIGVTP